MAYATGQHYPNRTFSTSIRENDPYEKLLESLKCDDLESYRELAKEQADIKRSLLSQYVEDHRTTPVYVLIEEEKKGQLLGHSEHYVEVRLPVGAGNVGETVPVLLSETDGEVCYSK